MRLMGLGRKSLLCVAAAVVAVVLGGCAQAPAPRAGWAAVDVMDGATSSPTPAPPVVKHREEVVKEKIPFKKKTIRDATLSKGKKQLVTPGKAGTRTLIYDVTVVDGKEASRELVSNSVTRNPTTQVTRVGTRVVPQRVQQPSNCDPNYSGACVPIASDVDCGGGSGNGPAYLYATARVVGIDIYGLDRDGDGLACE